MKAVKWIVLVALCGVLGYILYEGIRLFRLPVARLADPRATISIQVQDWHGKLHPFQVGPRNQWWTPLERIPREMHWAVILAEDANFYRHEGIDIKAIKEAITYDLKQKRLARGASTITQQLAKNLFLSREKTFTRKFKEMIIAKRMERTLTKGRILELYLNTIELGPMVYGIGHGARYYFDKPASALSPRECAFLAAMLPGPQKVYNPYRHMDRVLQRSDTILRQMLRKGVLNQEEYHRAVAEVPDIRGMQRKVEQGFAGKVRQFFKGLFGL